MPMETLGFNDKDARNEQYRKWKADGSKGVSRYSTHNGNDPGIVWVVTRSEPELSNKQTDEEKLKNLLTDFQEHESIDSQQTG